MSEEQYFIDDDGFVVDKTDLHILMDNDDCCEELNILYEENKKLKLKINTFIEGNGTLQARLKEVSAENKKLNERIGILEGSLIDKGFDIND